MGSKYKACCCDCGHEFTLYKGGGMAWYQKICNQCDAEVRVPRNGPVDFIDGVTLTYVELLKHLSNPAGWSRRGGRFDAVESKMLSDMTSACGCGGELIPEWDKRVKYRCPSCKSDRLDLKMEVLYD